MTTGPSQHSFQAPTGTRDFYPAELARLRYVQDAWRRTSINHGFDEIDGPTFEHLELYEKKSGEGIVSELFSFERFGGEKRYALRPEFTPTLARMYAAKAASLPKPTKWFWMQNCYRAERPQRGRLREFCQWNCDIIGTDSALSEPEASARADAEVIACAVGTFESLGLTKQDVRIKLNSRRIVEFALAHAAVESVCQFDAGFRVLDGRDKVSPIEYRTAFKASGFDSEQYDYAISLMAQATELGIDEDMMRETDEANKALIMQSLSLRRLMAVLDQMDLRSWCDIDFTITRGLAYYTGMVFEVHEASGAERAIAGGGRYDKLIEMFGGPPTPAVGFGMGDVVLSLVLQDKGLFPTDDAVADRLGLRPDVFVISNGQPDADAQVVPTLAALRRAGLHARRTSKTTKNVGKLLADAVKSRARFALIIESAEAGQLKDLATQEQRSVELATVPDAWKR